MATALFFFLLVCYTNKKSPGREDHGKPRKVLHCCPPVAAETISWSQCRTETHCEAAGTGRANVGAAISRPRAIDNRPYKKDEGCTVIRKHILILIIEYSPKTQNRKHIIPDFRKMTCFLLIDTERTGPKAGPDIFAWKVRLLPSYFRDSSTATATETVIPTMGLLPAPRKPIIST